ncbi:hypothetical protein GCM10020229_57030 [Kitasatospora albolonga]
MVGGRHLGASAARPLPSVPTAACHPADDPGEGGRPPGFDKERYKKRNTVERAINKLKNSRTVATRYGERGYVFLGTVTVAAPVIWLHT